MDRMLKRELKWTDDEDSPFLAVDLLPLTVLNYCLYIFFFFKSASPLLQNTLHNC